MQLKNVIILSFIILLWGSSFTILKLGLEEISPINLAFLRFLLALPFFIAITYFQDKKNFDMKIFQDWKILIFLGLTGITSYHTFQNLGLRFTTASNSSLIISANPIFIALLSYFYLKEKMNLKRVSGIILAFFGILLIIGPYGLVFNPIGVIGDLLSLCAGLSWAFYSIFGKTMLPKYGAQRITMFSMIFGTLFLFPILIVSEEPMLPTSIWLWFSLLFLSLLCSGLAYFLWYKVLEEVPATEAGVSLFFLPIVSVLFARLILLEAMTKFFVIGAFLVILGVIITEKG